MQDSVKVLTPSENKTLTGATHHKAQIRILRSWGIPFGIGLDGSPRVLREHLKVVAGAAAVARREAQPNLKGLARR